MLNLTSDERRVILFLSFLILLSCGISFLVKVYSPAQKIILNDKRLGRLDINRTTIKDLRRLNTIPDKLALKIIEYRDSVTRFNALEDLKNVKGVGEVRYQKLKEYFYVE